MAKRRKKKIPLTTKCAAALLMVMVRDEHGNLVRAITHHEAQQLTDWQIISLFDFDHYPQEEQDGGPTIAWNLTPRLKPEHRKKTGADAKRRAKGRRLRAAQARHAVAMAIDRRAVPDAEEAPKANPRKRRLVAAVKQNDWRRKFKRKFNGQVVPRSTSKDLMQ
ncbi:MAG: hypothetical protein KA472_11235 [Pseudomonadales bacterium]|nr:hypothetical protein [Pseudomonadales bacterium]